MSEYNTSYQNNNENSTPATTNNERITYNTDANKLDSENELLKLLAQIEKQNGFYLKCINDKLNIAMALFIIGCIITFFAMLSSN